METLLAFQSDAASISSIVEVVVKGEVEDVVTDAGVQRGQIGWLVIQVPLVRNNIEKHRIQVADECQVRVLDQRSVVDQVEVDLGFNGQDMINMAPSILELSESGQSVYLKR